MRVLNTASYISEEDLSSLTENDREAMYNGLDCCVTLELLNTLLQELDDESRGIYQLSLDLRGPIMDMALRGIRVDQIRRAQVLDEKQAIRRRLSAMLHRLLKEGLGLELNYRSTPDLKYLFYTVLNIKPIKKRNAQGIMAPTVNRDALERLEAFHFAGPFCRFVMELRELDKQISFLQTGIDDDGRMRATFNIAGTNTGRLSSSISEFGTGTNMQNVDRALRSIFIPDPGKKFINLDLRQGDSCNMGAMMWNIFLASHGPAFAGSYLDVCESSDLHTAVTQMTWPELDWPADGDPKLMRKVADAIFYRQDSYRQTSKKLGHGTNYRGQAPTMAMHTKMPVKIISNFQARYFASFPVIPEYHVWIEQQLNQYAMLRTLHGRQRYFFGRLSDPKTINEAVAFPSQSMTADAVNKATVQLWRSNLPIQLLCQVHDSLLLQVPEEQADDLIEPILAAGRAPLILAGDRPFVVQNEAKVGWNWGDYDKKNPDDNPYGLLECTNGDKRSPPTRGKLSIRRFLGNAATGKLD